MCKIQPIKIKNTYRDICMSSSYIDLSDATQHLPLASPLKINVKSPLCHFMSLKSTSVLSILLKGKKSS